LSTMTKIKVKLKCTSMGEAVKILATPMLRDQELLRYTACMLSVCL